MRMAQYIGIEFGVVIKAVGGALANGLKDKCDVINTCAAFMVTSDCSIHRK